MHAKALPDRGGWQGLGGGNHHAAAQNPSTAVSKPGSFLKDRHNQRVDYQNDQCPQWHAENDDGQDPRKAGIILCRWIFKPVLFAVTIWSPNLYLFHDNIPFLEQAVMQAVTVIPRAMRAVVFL